MALHRGTWPWRTGRGGVYTGMLNLPRRVRVRCRRVTNRLGEEYLVVSSSEVGDERSEDWIFEAPGR